MFAYNKRLISPAEVPHTHPEFERLLRTHAESYRGKVATYDPMESESGMLFISEDIRLTRDTWDLVRAFGATKTVFYSHNGDILQHIAAGTQIIGYNVVDGCSGIAKKRPQYRRRLPPITCC